MATITIVDESEHRVIFLDWQDLDALPELTDDMCVSAQGRTFEPHDQYDFLAELRRLNSTVLIAA